MRMCFNRFCSDFGPSFGYHKINSSKHMVFKGEIYDKNHNNLGGGGGGGGNSFFSVQHVYILLN